MSRIFSEAYIVDYIRTPVGKFRGSLSNVRADDMAALVIKEIIKRNPSVDTEKIDDVLMGNANQAGEDNRNVARMSLLLAGIPYSVPGETINRLCASGMSAVLNAARAIKLGEGDIYIAGGVENMTRAPFVLGKSEGAFSGKIEMYDSSIGWRFVNPKLKEMYGIDSMGETAENLAEKYSVTREEQDKFAEYSQHKAAKAWVNGKLQEETMPVKINLNKNELIFDTDEFIKPDTKTSILSKLKPAFRSGGSVTAGNSSGLNDGSAALLICSENAVKKYNLIPKAKIIAGTAAGVEPRIMGIGPVYATRRLFDKMGFTMDDMDLIEINEAFAVQVLACLKEFGIDPSDERINPNGGAIAIGHPLGMSGARLIGTVVNELTRTGNHRALCTMCIGVGQGMSVIVERV